MTELRSAVVVGLSIPPAIEAIRRAHVPVAGLGVPPHVTILSPFLPAGALDAAVRRRLRAIALAEPATVVRFERLERFPDALYLDPEPADPFRRLTVAVCAAFPGHPPYGEPSYDPAEMVPHLTIAIGDGTGFDELAARAGEGLPVTSPARALTVLAEGPDGRWQTRWRIPLGGPGRDRRRVGRS